MNLKMMMMIENRRSRGGVTRSRRRRRRRRRRRNLRVRSQDEEKLLRGEAGDKQRMKRFGERDEGEGWILGVFSKTKLM